MAKNIQEFVAEKVIEHLEKTNVELNIYRHVFDDKLLNCKMCNSFVVPVDEDKKEYKNLWICPCEFCYIDDISDVYGYGSPFTRGLGAPYCDSIYCKSCVEKQGYNNLFVRFEIQDRRRFFRIANFNGQFHDNFGKKTHYNMCIRCYKEDYPDSNSD